MFGLGNMITVGYDLSNEYAQISYLENGKEPAKTVSLVKGTEEYNIPLCLFKRKEVNQWFVGKEAINYSTVEEGDMVDGLWERAVRREIVKVGDEEFDSLALLSLFIKRSMVLLYSEVKKELVSGIMFTVPSLTKESLAVLEEVVSSIDFKNAVISLQSREESIYYYVCHQPTDLWNHDVMVYDCFDNNLLSFHFRVNVMTKPKVAFVERKVYPFDYSNSDDKDEAFLEIVKETTTSKIVSLVYLLGAGFDGDWTRNSTKEVCRNRRAFKGNNLYSRGAAYAMYEKLSSSLDSRKMIFLGEDKLRANVGMEVMRAGEEAYLALLDGGENWFDSHKEVDIILDEGNSFVIKITPLDGRNIKYVEVILDGLAEHENKAVRIRLEVMMESEDRLRVNATDMGFGEFTKASNQLFTKEILLGVGTSSSEIVAKAKN